MRSVLFAAAIGAMVSGCTTIHQMVQCHEGSKDYQRVSDEFAKWETGQFANSIPDDMDSTGRIPELAPIEKYAECSNYALLVPRYQKLRDRWASLAAANRAALTASAQEQRLRETQRAASHDVQNIRSGRLNGTDAYYWELSQLTDDYAVFSLARVPYVVAVERTSIDPRIAVTQGMSLLKMTHCVQWERDESAKNFGGFDTKVKVYKAIRCDP